MQRPRDKDSPHRLHQVLAFCDEPRTMAEILAEFGGDQRYRFAVFNAVKAGKMENANAGRCIGFPGLYKVTASAIRDEAEEQRPMLLPDGRRVASVWQLGSAA